MALRDRLGRTIRDLRTSVTDRCNLRCVYCMPAKPAWLPRSEILTFGEIVRVVDLCVRLGIESFRRTGGEPTARRDLVELTAMIARRPGVQDLAMTTNGVLLAPLARPLREAGLRRLNVSLDTLREERFVHIARREGLDRVIEGLASAERAGFAPIKVNTVVVRGFNEDEVPDLARLARKRPYQVRFIEFMPLDGDRAWGPDKVVPASEILDGIREAGELVPLRTGGCEPARVWRFADGAGEVGIIAGVTAPFCDSCDRIRLTAEGKLRTCLFATREVDLRALLRGGASDEEIADAISAAVWNKEHGHRIGAPDFVQPERAMYAIGG